MVGAEKPESFVVLNFIFVKLKKKKQKTKDKMMLVNLTHITSFHFKRKSVHN